MNLIPSILGLCLLVSEVFLALRRRSHSSQEQKDQGTLKNLWRIILFSMLGGILLASFDIGPRLPFFWLWLQAGVVLFLVGTVLRWWSIIHLGRFFTVDVAVAEDHQLVNNGPYRFIRHPSYTGLLLQFTGIALGLGHVLSLVVILVPIFLAFQHRIRVEEMALAEKLGEPYRQYCASTKRLLFFLY